MGSVKHAGRDGDGDISSFVRVGWWLVCCRDRLFGGRRFRKLQVLKLVFFWKRNIWGKDSYLGEVYDTHEVVKRCHSTTRTRCSPCRSHARWYAYVSESISYCHIFTALNPPSALDGSSRVEESWSWGAREIDIPGSGSAIVITV